MQLFYCPGIKEGVDFLDAEESHHCTKVLRKSAGDIIDITDGIGNFYTAEILKLNPKKSYFKIISATHVDKHKHSVHIAVAPTKNTDRMEWFIEKAVEIGIDKVSFIITSNSERKKINTDRIKKKAVGAMKQSLRAYLPEICDTEKFSFFLHHNLAEQKFLAHLETEETPFLENLAKRDGDYLILIGPEGGFSNEEVITALDSEFQIVKIGNYRLRTETAALVACTLLNQLNH